MKQWRAKHLTFHFGRTRRLHVTVRRFYASKARRSQAYKQLVIDLDLGPYKEIAFRWQRLRAGKRTSHPNFWQFRISTPYLAVVAGIIGFGYFGNQLVAAKSLEPVTKFNSAPTAVSLASKALPYSVPTHLKIASVGIDVDLISVGKASDGTIQTPPVLDWVAGWYKYSPTPGQVGPAVIVGHVDSYKGISVFWRLRDVKRGDIAEVTRADGSVARFKITTLEQYDQANFPTQTVYGNINYPGLRLITCGGSFNTQTGSYDQNTVVSGFLAT